MGFAIDVPSDEEIHLCFIRQIEGINVGIILLARAKEKTQAEDNGKEWGLGHEVKLQLEQLLLKHHSNWVLRTRQRRTKYSHSQFCPKQGYQNNGNADEHPTGFGLFDGAGDKTKREYQDSNDDGSGGEIKKVPIHNSNL